jgi:aspartyl-tRNA(Asn)/glutamyl-tRNA(Gln) amidotransferase subunit A
LRHYLERIERFDDELRSFLDLRAADAMNEAEASERRLKAGEALSAIDGWVVGIKANIAVAGLPHHAGIAAYKDDIAVKDAEAVRRLKDAGAIVLGTVNMHEGALGATTDNAAFGRTYNPWDKDRTPGGSSGGSAAAVAARLCDVALGSDTMGSVRIPSAYCGIQGIKPTMGLISDQGVLALSPSLDHIGVHGTSIDALRHVLAVIAGKRVARDERGMANWRWGVWCVDAEVEFEAPVIDAFQDVVSFISGKTQVTQIEPPLYEYGASRRRGLLVSEREGALIHRERLRTAPEGFSKGFRDLLAWGEAQSQDKVDAAMAHIAAIRKAALKFFEGVDLVLAPTAPQQAFRWDDEVPANQADLTAWANFAGLPAAVVFTGLSANGLPMSCQIIGPPGADGLVLAAAAEFEANYGAPPVPPGF